MHKKTLLISTAFIVLICFSLIIPATSLARSGKVGNPQPEGPLGQLTCIDKIDNDLDGNIDADDDDCKKELNAKVILVEFSDKLHRQQHNKRYYEKKIISDLVSYHKENSFGQVILQESFDFITPNHGEWFKLENKKEDDYDDGSDKGDIQQFFADVISLVESATSFRLSALDEKKDVLIIVYSEAWNDRTAWPIKGPLTTCAALWYKTDGVITKCSEGNYKEAGLSIIFLSENNKFSTWAHEIGHTIGAFDLYEAGNVSKWGLMGKGWGKNPPHMTSYMKWSLQWLNYNSIEYGTYWINSLVTSNFGDYVQRYVINEDKYYVLEVRTNDIQYSDWDRYAPNDALVLYQVDESGEEPNINIPSYGVLKAKKSFKDIFLKVRKSFTDCDNNVKFTALEVDKSNNKYQIKVKIEKTEPEDCD